MKRYRVSVRRELDVDARSAHEAIVQALGQTRLGWSRDHVWRVTELVSQPLLEVPVPDTEWQKDVVAASEEREEPQWA